MNLAEFLNQDQPNVWINEPGMAVYMRKGKRYITGPECIPCLDIANIEVDIEKRGQGYFTNFLKHVETTAKSMNCAVFVESVMLDSLASFLKHQGYSDDPRTVDSIVPSFFKLPEDLCQ